MSHEHATEPGLVLVSESLRERIARYAAGGGPESNWSVVVGESPLVVREEHEPCPDCDGLGFVALPESELSAFAERVANIRDEATKAAQAGRLDRERQLSEKIRDEHWRLNRNSVCKTCRGSCYLPPEDDGSIVTPHDSFFTTVTCERCRGSDRRKHPRLMDRHQGSSSGRECPDCSGGYVVPITVRPVGKGGDPGAYIEELEDVPIYHRAGGRAESSPEDVIVSAALEDPKLAAATVAYMGVNGDTWAKHEWGKRFSVWPFLRSGERLVAESSFKPPTSGTWYERAIAVLEHERAANRESPNENPRRRMLISRADCEARAMTTRIERFIDKHEAA